MVTQLCPLWWEKYKDIPKYLWILRLWAFITPEPSSNILILRSKPIAGMVQAWVGHFVTPQKRTHHSKMWKVPQKPICCVSVTSGCDYSQQIIDKQRKLRWWQSFFSSHTVLSVFVAKKWILSDTGIYIRKWPFSICIIVDFDLSDNYYYTCGNCLSNT